jgi:hypothetical protein
MTSFKHSLHTFSIPLCYCCCGNVCGPLMKSSCVYHYLSPPRKKKRNLLSDAKIDSSSKWIRRVLRQRWMSSKRKYTERAKRKDQMSREKRIPFGISSSTPLHSLNLLESIDHSALMSGRSCFKSFSTYPSTRRISPLMNKGNLRTSKNTGGRKKKGPRRR